MKVKEIENKFCIACENDYISDKLPKFNSYQEAVEWLEQVTNKLQKAALEIKKANEEIEKETGASQAKLTLKPKWSYK